MVTDSARSRELVGKSAGADLSVRELSSSRLNIAVVGSGAAGLSAAWLLSGNHSVCLFETDDRAGGHAHTAYIDESARQLVSDKAVDDSSSQSATPVHANASRALAVDTGFIVYNDLTYPNFVAWMQHLAVDTQATNMSFAVSRDNGGFEYAGGSWRGLFAQPMNVMKPRFWKMLSGIVRFYREAVSACESGEDISLGEFLSNRNYSQTFIHDHLLPFGAAIWSTPQQKMLDYPVRSFVRFCDNHGLLKLYGRPQWRTLTGGSHTYVTRVLKNIDDNDGKVVLDQTVKRVRRLEQGVEISSVSADGLNVVEHFDHVVLACHADQALALLESPSESEDALLRVFDYEENLAILHTDVDVMPKRRAAWSSWNYVEQPGDDLHARPGVVYWMNKLQNLHTPTDYFVSLNPQQSIDRNCIVRESAYHHPLFNEQTYQAQQKLWHLQGAGKTWFCGSYFGSGFHEDAVQSGLAVAEALGGVRRPWQVEDESSRIVLLGSDSVPAAKMSLHGLDQVTVTA